MRACKLLLILSAKRNLGDTVIKGVEDMSLLIDPMEDTFFRRLYEKGLTEGVEKGEARFLLLTLRQKFGPLLASSEEKVNCATSAQLEIWMTRILTATTLDQVLN